MREVPCPLPRGSVPGNDTTNGGAVGQVTGPAAVVANVAELSRGLPEAGSAGAAGTPARDGGPRLGAGGAIPQPLSAFGRTNVDYDDDGQSGYASSDEGSLAPERGPGRQDHVPTPARGGEAPLRVMDDADLEGLRQATTRATEALRTEEAVFAAEVAFEDAPLEAVRRRRPSATSSIVVAEALSQMAGIVQAGARERSWLIERVDAQQDTLRGMGLELTQGMGRIAEEVHQEVADVALSMRGCREEMQRMLEQLHTRLGRVGGDGHPPEAIMAEGHPLAIEGTPSLGDRRRPLNSTVLSRGGRDSSNLGRGRLPLLALGAEGGAEEADVAVRGRRRVPPVDGPGHISGGTQLDVSQGAGREYRVPKDLLISVLPYDGGDQVKQGSWNQWRQELSRRLKGHPTLSDAQVCSLLHQKLSGEAGRVLDRVDEQVVGEEELTPIDYWTALDRHFNTGDRLQRSEEEVHALEYREAEPFADFSKLLKAKLRQAFPTESSKQEQQGLFVLRRVLKGTPLGTVMTLYTSLNKRADLQEVLEHLNLQDDRGPARAGRGRAGPGRPSVLAGVTLPEAAQGDYVTGEEEARGADSNLMGTAVAAAGQGQSGNQTSRRGRNRNSRGRGRGSTRGRGRDVGEQQSVPTTSPAPERPAEEPTSQSESLQDILRGIGRRMDQIADRQAQYEERLGNRVIEQVDRRLQEQYQRLTSSRGRGRPGYPNQGSRGGYTRTNPPGAGTAPPAGRWPVEVRQPSIRCFRCDKEGHYARNCPLRNCHYCDECLDVLYQQGAFSTPDYCGTCSPGEDDGVERSLVAARHESGTGNW